MRRPWRKLTHYNPWPLGALPEGWQRPEPGLIREFGYDWDDPRDIVGMFEDKLALFSGSKYAVSVDCCTHAIFLSLKYLQQVTNSDSLSKNGVVRIPDKTYVSVPMQILHAGLIPAFDKIEWSGAYLIGDTGIIDGAGRFTSGMYTGGNSLHTLSFQIKKRLPIGRGGAILTDSKEAYEWLKLATYDGRDLLTPYDSPGHVSTLGWHYYMTPEDAARGILLMDQLQEVMPDTMSSQNYPSLSNMQVFSDLSQFGGIERG
jgi:dTDP-4-amino-4,6-dideoxygalactose transaminase